MQRLTTRDILRGMSREQKRETLAEIRKLDDADARAAQRDVERLLAEELEGRPRERPTLPKRRAS